MGKPGGSKTIVASKLNPPAAIPAKPPVIKIAPKVAQVGSAADAKDDTCLILTIESKAIV